MIINTNESSIELIGDIKEFKTGIDPKNLELITTLLSSNLYSAPERSFIREIVSNAWDSHVEAGTTDTPVLIKIGDNYVTIRDFGTGMSEERFKDVYCNIGSSTKRGSNDFIGGFGIGKFSSLAVSDTVSIISYYNGKAYHYMMVKDGNHITNNLITVVDTEEKNGVEITVSNLTNMTKYYEALRYIVFFPNIYVDSKLKNSINNTKIKFFKNFVCSSIDTPFKLLLGNVLYPLDMSILGYSSKEKDFIYKINGTGIAIRFNIGEIEVTPNRESIIYSDKTIGIIKNRIKDAITEFYSMISDIVLRDYDNIGEWASLLTSRLYFDILENKVTSDYNGCNISFNLSELSSLPTFKGKAYSRDVMQAVYNIIRSKVYWGKCVINSSKIYSMSTRLPYRIDRYATYSCDKVLKLNNDERLSQAIKLFLKTYYDDYIVTKNFSYAEFSDFYRGDFNYYADNQYTDYFLKEIYDWFTSKVVTIDTKTDKKFLEYKETLKATPNEGGIAKETCYLYVHTSTKYNRLVHSGYVNRNPRNFNSIDSAISYIRGIKGTVVFDSLNGDREEILCPLGYIYITASAKVLKILKKTSFKNVRDIDWVLNNDRNLKRLSFIIHYNFPSPFSISLITALDILPDNISDKLLSLRNYYDKYQHCEELFFYIKQNTEFKENSYYKYLKDVLDNLKEKLNYIYNKTSRELNHYSSDNYLVIAIIFKLKAFRINYRTYTELKNNQMLKLLLWQK